MGFAAGRQLIRLIKKNIGATSLRWSSRETTRLVQAMRREYSAKAATRTTSASMADANNTCVVPVFKKAVEFGDRVAIRDSQGEYTYRGLLEASLRLAGVITKRLGGDTQERVAFLCPNNASYVIVQWACWISGHIGVPLSVGHEEGMLEYLVADSDSCLIVTVPQYMEAASRVAGKLSCQVHVLEDSERKEAMKKEEALKRTEKECALDPDKIGKDPMFYNESDALILYTSGSSGSPKGVVVSHLNLESQIKSMVKAWQWQQKDCILHVLPLNHILGVVNALLCPLSVGARCVLMEKFDTSDVWMELMGMQKKAVDRVNMLIGVPEMYAQLIEEYDSELRKSEQMMEYIKETLCRKIRLMLCGSAPLPKMIFERWEDITGHQLLEKYGMTETGMVLANPLQGERVAGTVGIPLPGVKVRVVSSQDESNILAEGTAGGTRALGLQSVTVGQLQVKSDSVFRRYWRRPSSNRQEFTPDAWFNTGDIVQYSKGMYTMLGKECTDIIKTGGFNVSALQVESTLRDFEPIKDVAVVGIDDNTWGKKVAAVISMKSSRDSLDVEELRDWAKCRLPEYAVPSLFKTLESIPRDQLGKVNKPQLVHDVFLANSRNT